jgi:hypothetical protein
MRLGRHELVLRLTVVLLTLTVVMAEVVTPFERSSPLAGVSYAAPGDPAPMPTSRGYTAAATAANGKIYVAGGVAGSPSSGASPAPNCSPRPRVNVHTEVAIGIPEAGGAMKVTVSTSGSNNGLRAVRFDSFSNAIVHAGSQDNQATPFAVSIPPGQEPTSLVFFVQRQTPGQTTTVTLVVVDGCGEWSTLVGGGPNAF